jgi:hypothetical protein
MKATSKAAAGLSLLELLVVIAVIAALVALVMPALGRAKAKAPTTLAPCRPRDGIFANYRPRHARFSKAEIRTLFSAKLAGTFLCRAEPRRVEVHGMTPMIPFFPVGTRWRKCMCA